MTREAPETVAPAFARGVRLRFDKTRDAWIVLGPERLFLPDEHAIEVLKLVDGARTLAAIIDDLAARYAAPRQEIAEDVTAMLVDFADKGAVTL